MRKKQGYDILCTKENNVLRNLSGIKEHTRLLLVSQIPNPSLEPVSSTISKMWSCLEEAAASVRPSLFLYRRTLMSRDMMSAGMLSLSLIKQISEKQT